MAGRGTDDDEKSTTVKTFVSNKEGDPHVLQPLLSMWLKVVWEEEQPQLLL